MMRELRFRVWNNEVNSWRYLDLLEDARITLLDTDDLSSLGQSTGLLDCDEKEIWEGDYLKYIAEGEEYEHIKRVDFLNGCFRLIINFYKGSGYASDHLGHGSAVGQCCKWRAIGNRFENSELWDGSND